MTGVPVSVGVARTDKTAPKKSAQPDLEALMYALGTAACNCPPCSARRSKVGEWLLAHDAAVAKAAVAASVGG